ncbi:glucosaminidase domain-containing protein [Catellatospora tritici]|uniref:glucosaminidase domain-containing protein n=1 Tax=Catellatospora tritici TaxID=2851566 RepID=UPI001C2D7AB6|nr:glucosaminidase domain-containing protein [Catellatospora tritici]MBV1852355.1 glucosaminidase domain-containing protein [Catellatospora tritici]
MSVHSSRIGLLLGLLASALLLPTTAHAEPAAPAARVHAEGGVLAVRAGPGVDRPVTARLADGTAVMPRCRVWGQRLTGPLRGSAYWVLVDGGMVPDAFLAWSPGRAAMPDGLAWCAESGRPGTARVAAGGGELNIRSGPGTGHDRVGALDDGAPLAVRCQAWGQAVGDGRRSPVWLRLGSGGYVAQAYVRWSPGPPRLPWCGQEPPGALPAGARAFALAYADAARTAARATGVPASVLLAQAAEASGWGRAATAYADHDLFRRDCVDGPGTTALGCRDGLRAYRSPREAFLDQARLLATRLGGAPAPGADPDRFASALARAGYGTAAQAERLTVLMRRYDLYRYDR